MATHLMKMMATYLMKLFLILDELPMISNLCAKDVRMMYLQISSDVTEKRIPLSAREMINIICHNLYATFVKETSAWMQ